MHSGNVTRVKIASRPFGAALALAMIMLVLPMAAGASPTPGDKRVESMRAILESAVKTLGAPVNTGGFSILVRTPEGDHFASTVPGASPDSHFRAASVTKTTTAAAVMLLVERGELRLDDSLTMRIPGRLDAYLPDMPEYAIPNKSRITIRQLLRHRAGVWDVGNEIVPAGLDVPYAGRNYIDWVLERDPYHTFTRKELVDVVARTGMNYGPPDGQYHYSNTGYTLLGTIIERVSGVRLYEFLQREFLGTLGLGETYFVALGSDRFPRPPRLLGWSAGDGMVMETTEDNASYAHAEGNMVTTFPDLATWMRALLRGRAGISARNVAMMTELVPSAGAGSPGYGFGMIDKPQGLGFGHDGAIMGYMTLARHDPDSDITTVLVSTYLNFDDLAGLQAAMYKAALEAKALF